MGYIISAMASWNYDSINTLLILLVTFGSFAIGKIRSRWSWLLVAVIFVAAYALFNQVDWA